MASCRSKPAITRESGASRGEGRGWISVIFPGEVAIFSQRNWGKENFV